MSSQSRCQSCPSQTRCCIGPLHADIVNPQCSCNTWNGLPSEVDNPYTAQFCKHCNYILFCWSCFAVIAGTMAHTCLARSPTAVTSVQAMPKRPLSVHLASPAFSFHAGNCTLHSYSQLSQMRKPQSRSPVVVRAADTDAEEGISLSAEESTRWEASAEILVNELGLSRDEAGKWSAARACGHGSKVCVASRRSAGQTDGKRTHDVHQGLAASILHPSWPWHPSRLLPVSQMPSAVSC